jgi:cysteinyl-tRNA synthetase
MLEIIGKLITRGHAYAAEGHVLFDVPSDPDYGKLSRRPLDEMIAGARVEVAPYKRAPTDFVLWKPSAPGEPAWDSPWGRGRPGWHLECSAMSWKHLGEIFDIHGGGIDLVFPHHENEIAQTCSAFGHDVMANYWMHNGHLQVEGEKMSKSLGNFVTIHELLHTDKFGGRSWPGEVLRLALLRTHYRQPIDFTVKALEEADNDLRSWWSVLGGIKPSDVMHQMEIAPNNEDSLHAIQPLLDDLNIPEVLAVLHQQTKAAQENQEARRRAIFVMDVLGLIPKLAEVQNRLFRAVLTPQSVNGGQPTPSLESIAKEMSASQAAYIWLFGGRQAFADTAPIFHSLTRTRITAKLLKEFANEPEIVKSLVSFSNFINKLDLDHLPEAARNLKYANPEMEITDEIRAVIGKSNINERIELRLAARAAKNWKESDRIRDELAAMGIALKDNKDGTTTWEVNR